MNIYKNNMTLNILYFTWTFRYNLDKIHIVFCKVGYHPFDTSKPCPSNTSGSSKVLFSVIVIDGVIDCVSDWSSSIFNVAGPIVISCSCDCSC